MPTGSVGNRSSTQDNSLWCLGTVSNVCTKKYKASRLREAFFVLCMFYVYVIYSESRDVYYKGQTNNVADRLERHNGGYEKFTGTGAPWQLKCCIAIWLCFLLEMVFFSLLERCEWTGAAMGIQNCGRLRPSGSHKVTISIIWIVLIIPDVHFFSWYKLISF